MHENIDTPWTHLTHFGLVLRDIEETLSRYKEMGIGPFRHFNLPVDEFISFKWRGASTSANLRTTSNTRSRGVRWGRSASKFLNPSQVIASHNDSSIQKARV